MDTINESTPKPKYGGTLKYWQLQDQQRKLILFPKLPYLPTDVIINTQLHQHTFQLRLSLCYISGAHQTNKNRNLRHISEQQSNE